MAYDIVSVLELCGIAAAAIWFIGFCMLLIAVRKARSEFRGKGYLKPPSGRELFRFLMFKQYEAFDSAGIRFFFGLAHFCLVLLIIVLAAIVILVGCDQLFNGMSGISGAGLSGLPTLGPSK